MLEKQLKLNFASTDLRRNIAVPDKIQQRVIGESHYFFENDAVLTCIFFFYAGRSGNITASSSRILTNGKFAQTALF